MVFLIPVTVVKFYCYMVNYNLNCVIQIILQSSPSMEVCWFSVQEKLVLQPKFRCRHNCLLNASCCSHEAAEASQLLTGQQFVVQSCYAVLLIGVLLHISAVFICLLDDQQTECMRACFYHQLVSFCFVSCMKFIKLVCRVVAQYTLMQFQCSPRSPNLSPHSRISSPKFSSESY